MGRLLTLRLRTAFIHRDPKLTFLVTSASGADHSLRERTFSYYLRGTRGQYSIKRMDICPPRADLFRSGGPFICYVWTSVPRSRIAFIHREPPSGPVLSLALRVPTILSLA